MGQAHVQERKQLRQSAFLEAFAKHGIMQRACDLVGISRSSVHHWRETDKDFDARYREAEEAAADVVEAELYRRAVDGYDEPVIFQGVPSFVTDPDTGEQKMLTIKKYSDGLMLALIKARKPKQFRENQTVSHNFEGATGVLVVPAPISPEEWAKAAEAQQAKFAKNVGEKD